MVIILQQTSLKTTRKMPPEPCMLDPLVAKMPGGRHNNITKAMTETAPESKKWAKGCELTRTPQHPSVVIISLFQIVTQDQKHREKEIFLFFYFFIDLNNL